MTTPDAIKYRDGIAALHAEVKDLGKKATAYIACGKIEHAEDCLKRMAKLAADFQCQPPSDTSTVCRGENR